MLNTVRSASLIGARDIKDGTFHKGRTYWATPATNQPDYKEKGLVFVEKANTRWSQTLLIGREDYQIVSGVEGLHNVLMQVFGE